MTQSSKPTYNATYLLVDFASKSERVIYFYADPRTAAGLSEYGNVDNVKSDLYCLAVLGGYDFQEVLDYIKQ